MLTGEVAVGGECGVVVWSVYCSCGMAVLSGRVVSVVVSGWSEDSSWGYVLGVELEVSVSAAV